MCVWESFFSSFLDLLTEIIFLWIDFFLKEWVWRTKEEEEKHVDKREDDGDFGSTFSRMKVSFKRVVSIRFSLSAFESYISLIGFQSPAPFAIFSDSVVAVQRFKVNASKTYQSEDRWTIIKMQMRFGSLRFFSRYFYEQLEYITIT